MACEQYANPDAHLSVPIKNPPAYLPSISTDAALAAAGRSKNARARSHARSITCACVRVCICAYSD